MQSIVRALGLEHPCIQDPLKASQPPLHLVGQIWEQFAEYLVASQPTRYNRTKQVFFFLLLVS